MTVFRSHPMAAIETCSDCLRLQTLRLIAERVLRLTVPMNKKAVYLQGEAENQRVRLKRPQHSYHLYCSPLNPGGADLVDELRIAFAQDLKLLKVSTDISQLEDCDRFLIYLNSRTWTRGTDSDAFAHEVVLALQAGLPLLPVHEFPSAISRSVISRERHACDFGDFFNDGWTPKHLMMGEHDIYQVIAIALKDAEWRKAGLAAVRSKLAAHPGVRVPLSASASSLPPPVAIPTPAAAVTQTTSSHDGANVGIVELSDRAEQVSFNHVEQEVTCMTVEQEAIYEMQSSIGHCRVHDWAQCSCRGGM